MKRLADGLYLLHGLPPYAINVYLMGDVIVDAGTRHAARRILRQVRGHPRLGPGADARPPRPPGLLPRGLRGAGHPPVVRRRRRRGGRGPRADAPAAAEQLADPDDRPALGRAGPPGRAAAPRGGRGRRLHRAGDAGPLRRPRLLLARGRPRARPRRRPGQLPAPGRAPRPLRTPVASSHPTRPRIAARPAGSPRWSRRWSASATGRPCATRRGSSSSSDDWPID